MTVRMLAVALLVLVGVPALCCPHEIVTYPQFTLRTLSGRIEPESDGLLPGDVEFIVRKRDGETSSEWVVPVSPAGEFSFALGEGSYDFTIKAEGFLFELVGTVVISSAASEEARMEVRPPWC